MKKLSLDELQVETFEPSAGQQGRLGTVKAHDYGTNHTLDPTCDTCGREWTLEGTCDATCGPAATCGYDYCGTYPEHGCPNSYWFCTDCQVVC